MAPVTAISARRADITTLAVDAIVNAAKPSLRGGGGVDGAIHRVGGTSIVRECMAITDRLGNLPAGAAVATGAGKLPASHVIHTVGPVWDGRDPDAADETLASCYRACLSLVVELGARSIAFPSISTGVYGYPVDRAAGIAVSATRTWIAGAPDALAEVIFVCFDGATLGAYDKALRRTAD